jgi:hypothetical protein
MVGLMRSQEFVVEVSDERKQHGAINRAGRQMADAQGGIGQPWIARDLLASMEARGAITSPLRLAGEEFHRHFQRAAMSPIRAADVSRIPRLGAAPDHVGNMGARKCVSDALDALGGLGSPAGSCAWHILGCEMSVNEWARREGWSGRAIHPNVASGILIGALGILAKHFRL